MPPKAHAKAKVGATARTGPKPAAAKGGAKPATKTSGASKTTPGKADAAQQNDEKVEEKMAGMTIKKVMTPDEIDFKEVAKLYTFEHDVCKKPQNAEKWLFMIDRHGQVKTFLKYRDVNMIEVNGIDFNQEPLRKSLQGALKFGKPHVIDISGGSADQDQSKVMDKVRDTYNAIYKGCWDDIMERGKLDFEIAEKLYREGDPDEYKNKYGLLENKN